MLMIDLIILALLVPLSVAVVYLYFLALIGLTQKKKYPQRSKEYDFLILVPAHNEENDIAKTLHSLKKLE